MRLHDSSGAHINLGNILKERCDLDGALGHISKRSNALSHESMSNIGNVLKDLGRSVEAEDYYCRAISVSPGYVQLVNQVPRYRSWFIPSSYADAHANQGTLQG